MPWPANVRNEALAACQRSCSICHKFCGVRIELHHIKPESEGGPSTYDNCIPLCFDCHAEVQHYNSAHPKGTKFSSAELKLHRDRWFDRVATSSSYAVAPEHQVIDRRIAIEIHDYMTRDRSFQFLREETLKGSFLKRYVVPLYDLEQKFSNPDFEFFDADLEAARSDFARFLSRAVHEIATMTAPEKGDRDWLTGAPQYWMKDDDYKEWERQTRVADQVLTEAATAYEALYRLARTRLVLDLRFP
jgi:hypothetical protein